MRFSSTRFLITQYGLLLLIFPKLIIAGFDLAKFAGGDEDGAFTNIGNAVRKTFEVVSHPKQPVGAFDVLGVFNDEDHQLLVQFARQPQPIDPKQLDSYAKRVIERRSQDGNTTLLLNFNSL